MKRLASCVLTETGLVCRMAALPPEWRNWQTRRIQKTIFPSKTPKTAQKPRLFSTLVTIKVTYRLRKISRGLPLILVFLNPESTQDRMTRSGLKILRVIDQLIDQLITQFKTQLALSPWYIGWGTNHPGASARGGTAWVLPGPWGARGFARTSRHFFTRGSFLGWVSKFCAQLGNCAGSKGWPRGGQKWC